VERATSPVRLRTCRTHVQDVGDTHAVSTRGGLMADPRKNTQRYGRRVFDRVRPQNSVMAVPTGIRGGTWRHREGCVKAKELRVERVAVRSKSQELVHFALAKSIASMYLGVV
jgi:hypothetical protein